MLRFSKLFVSQKDHRQCGAVSLAMICALFGKRYSVEFMEMLCGSSKNGISVKAIREGAKQPGLETRAGRLDVSNLKKIQLPAILFWNNSHYVVSYNV